MSIVELRKVSVFGLTVEKELALRALQRAGVMHLIPLKPVAGLGEENPSDRPEACLEALKYLPA